MKYNTMYVEFAFVISHAIYHKCATSITTNYVEDIFHCAIVQDVQQLFRLLIGEKQFAALW